LAFLNDFVSPLKLAFVGGDAAKRYADRYCGTWMNDTPTVAGELLEFWGID
jgi:hypothetical protein